VVTFSMQAAACRPRHGSSRLDQMGGSDTAVKRFVSSSPFASTLAVSRDIGDRCVETLESAYERLTAVTDSPGSDQQRGDAADRYVLGALTPDRVSQPSRRLRGGPVRERKFRFRSRTGALVLSRLARKG
jgi:hypothetical protein